MSKPMSTTSISPGQQNQLMFNDYGFAQRNMMVGPVFDQKYGACTAATFVNKYATLYVFNTTAAVLYVKLGDSTVAGPFAITEAIPVLPNSTLALGSGEDTYVIASGAGLAVYSIKENIVVNP